MNKRKFARLLREGVTPERKREIAYHEAGHAAIQWMFGNANNIDHISMYGTIDFSAIVRTREYDFIKLILDSPNTEPIDKLPPTMQNVLRIQAKQRMMHDLAGYGTEGKLNPVDDWHWLDIQLDEGEWEYSEGDDINRAVKVAKAVCGDNGNAWRMLRKMAAWTDEAILHPRLWAVIDALAKQLVTVKKRMGGIKAYRIMEKAWGENTGLPYMDMGRQWRRRFTFANMRTLD
jgi:hypothetical protein